MKTKKAALAEAAQVTQHAPPYGNRCSLSRARMLEQAADVLCLSAFFPLNAAAEVGLAALLERRLHRAYGGPCHD